MHYPQLHMGDVTELCCSSCVAGYCKASILAIVIINFHHHGKKKYAYIVHECVRVLSCCLFVIYGEILPSIENSTGLCPFYFT